MFRLDRKKGLQHWSQTTQERRRDEGKEQCDQMLEQKVAQFFSKSYEGTNFFLI